MPAPKESAKKVTDQATEKDAVKKTPAKKAAAKKAPAKHAPDHAIKDERRAHEHMARVEGLHKHVEKPAEKDIAKLTEIARNELKAGHMKHAADLLRAAEHLSFGSLHGPKAKDVHPKLAEEFEHEFQSKMEKAEDHWSDEDKHPEGLEEIYASVKERAQKSLDEGTYPAALELARAVEALSHVHESDSAEEEDAEDETDEDEDFDDDDDDDGELDDEDEEDEDPADKK